MAGGNVSPRQKMINMMYLVLTAMLALNVSKDILKAFHLVEVSMEKAGKNIQQKNDDLMGVFASQAKNNPAKVGPFYDKAKKAMQINNDFIKYVRDLKAQVEKGAGGRKDGVADAELTVNDNIEEHANLLINQKKGEELRNKIEKTRTDLIGLLDKKDQVLIKSDLYAVASAKAIKGQTWESEIFEHSPAAAVVTILQKIENDAQNTTAQVLDELAKSISKDEQSFNTVKATIIPKSSFVMSGGKFEADIMIVAYDDKQSNEVTIGESKLVQENGVAKYEQPATGSGERKVEGYVTMKTKEGDKKYPFATSYNVFTGGATISADAMNMLYIGLDNPMSVSAPGFPPEKTIVTMSGGTLTKSGKGYIAKVSKRGEATVSVSVKMDDGTTKPAGKMTFRVREIPRPEPQLGTLQNGASESIGTIKANASRVFASLGASFAFEGVKYNITQFTFTLAAKRGESKPGVRVQGSTVSGACTSLLNGIKSGDKVILDDIKAVGPGGAKALPPVVITAR